MSLSLLEYVGARARPEVQRDRIQVQLKRIPSKELPFDLGCLLQSYQDAGPHIAVDADFMRLLRRLSDHALARRDSTLLTEIYVLEHMAACKNHDTP